MSEECGYEGGDCVDCFNLIPPGSESMVGNSFCNGGLFDSDECNSDGGDCNSNFEPLPPPGIETEVVVVADINGDGHKDLVIGNRVQHNLLLLNTGLGGTAETTFHDPMQLPGGALETYAIEVADAVSVMQSPYFFMFTQYLLFSFRYLNINYSN